MLTYSVRSLTGLHFIQYNRTLFQWPWQQGYLSTWYFNAVFLCFISVKKLLFVQIVGLKGQLKEWRDRDEGYAEQWTIICVMVDCIEYITGVIFVSYLTWFQPFSSAVKLPKIAGHSQNRSRMDTVRTGQEWTIWKEGCRWFQLFFIDFHLFYFLTRIIPII